MSATVRTLPPRRERFALEYVKDLNGAQAVIRAGYSRTDAHREAARLLADPDVRALVRELQEERARELKIEAKDILRDLIDIARADPNDLVQYQRLCCRHCWGVDFKYQRTSREMERDRQAHEKAELEKQKADDLVYLPQPFDEAGGEGYDGTRDPNEDCPECFGRGVENVHVADTRHLRGPARKLYAGVKVTKDGVQVLMHDQDKAREMIGRHLGMFLDRVEHSGQLDLAQRIVTARRRSSGG